jgi:uncharacterized protein YukE
MRHVACPAAPDTPTRFNQQMTALKTLRRTTMTRIRIDTVQAENVALRLTRVGHRLHEIRWQLNHAIGQLDLGVWEGTSRARIEPQLSRVDREARALADLLDGQGKRLMRIVGAFKKADQVRPLPWDLDLVTTSDDSTGQVNGRTPEKPQGDESLTEFPYPPGSDQWTEADKSGDCWRYAHQRSGDRLKNCPDGFAQSLPDAYPPDKKITLTTEVTRGDLRDTGIEPGMAMVWQPDEMLYGENDPKLPPAPSGVYNDRRWASNGGHVAIVEEVGSNFIEVSDQYGHHRIEVPVKYRYQGQIREENFLVGPTFIDPI